MTTAQLLAIPEDHVKRELSKGRLRERGLNIGGRRHFATTANLAAILQQWPEVQMKPRDEVLAGGATFQLQNSPDTTVETDVAYMSADLAEMADEDAFIFDGVPTLAVEVLSPSDKQEDVFEKVQDYLDAGVPLVWLVEPIFKTVTVYRPGHETQLFSMKDELTAEPHLPGFKAPVATIFGG